MLVLEQLTERILGAAIEVHRELGPGLLESTYELCLCEELRLRGLRWERQVRVPVVYKGVRIEDAYRLDVVVEGQVLVEVKAVEKMDPIFASQTLTYLRHTGLKVGLLINFNVRLLREGIERIIG